MFVVAEIFNLAEKVKVLYLQFLLSVEEGQLFFDHETRWWKQRGRLTKWSPWPLAAPLKNGSRPICGRRSRGWWWRRRWTGRRRRWWRVPSPGCHQNSLMPSSHDCPIGQSTKYWHCSSSYVSSTLPGQHVDNTCPGHLISSYWPGTWGRQWRFAHCGTTSAAVPSCGRTTGEPEKWENWKRSKFDKILGLSRTSSGRPWARGEGVVLAQDEEALHPRSPPSEGGLQNGKIWHHVISGSEVWQVSLGEEEGAPSYRIYRVRRVENEHIEPVLRSSVQVTFSHFEVWEYENGSPNSYVLLLPDNLGFSSKAGPH